MINTRLRDRLLTRYVGKKGKLARAKSLEKCKQFRMKHSSENLDSSTAVVSNKYFILKPLE